MAFVGETVQLSFNVALGELVPNKYRPMILSFIFTNAPFAAFGPIMAPKLIQSGLGRRWWYYINIIAVGLAAFVLFLFYKPPIFDFLHERETKRPLMKQLDTLEILPLDRGLDHLPDGWLIGRHNLSLEVSCNHFQYPHRSGAIDRSVLVGRVHGFDMSLSVPWFSSVAQATVASMFYYSAVLLWPQQIIAMFMANANYAGWLACTVGSATALGQIFAGFILKWGEYVRYWLIFSACAMVGFVCALASLTPDY